MAILHKFRRCCFFVKRSVTQIPLNFVGISLYYARQ